jgi:hypothetical protein
MDSAEDQTIEDTHKLAQITHAVCLGQPITVQIRGQFDAGDHMDEIFIQKEFIDITKQSKIFEPLQLAYSSIEISSPIYGTEGIPGSRLWTQSWGHEKKSVFLWPKEAVDCTSLVARQALVA